MEIKKEVYITIEEDTIPIQISAEKPRDKRIYLWIRERKRKNETTLTPIFDRSIIDIPDIEKKFDSIVDKNSEITYIENKKHKKRNVLPGWGGMWYAISDEIAEGVRWIEAPWRVTIKWRIK